MNDCGFHCFKPRMALLSALFLFFCVALTAGMAAPSSGGVIVILPQPGLDMGQQIANCVTQLTTTGAHGGICDARAFNGLQYYKGGSPLDIGAPGEQVELLLGRVTFYTAQTIRVQQGSSIVGMAGAAIPLSRPDPTKPETIDGVGFAGSVIKQYPSANLNAVVELDGGFNLLQDVVVDGNKDSNVSGTAILVNRASRVQLLRVFAQFAPSYGIEFYSTAGGAGSNGDESCCAKLLNVMSAWNGDSGLYAVNTADVFVSVSEFEANGGSGVELCNSPTFRIEHSDIGGNGQDGIRVYGTRTGFSADREIVVGNQFGNNHGDDIDMFGASSSHLISSNQFIGASAPYYRKPGADGIRLSGANSMVVGNMFFTSSQPLHACIENIGGSSNQVTSNFCQLPGGVYTPSIRIPPIKTPLRRRLE